MQAAWVTLRSAVLLASKPRSALRRSFSSRSSASSADSASLLDLISCGVGEKNTRDLAVSHQCCHIHTHTHRYRQTQTDTDIDTQTHRHTQPHTDTHTLTQPHTATHRHTHNSHLDFLCGRAQVCHELRFVRCGLCLPAFQSLPQLLHARLRSLKLIVGLNVRRSRRLNLLHQLLVALCQRHNLASLVIAVNATTAAAAAAAAVRTRPMRQHHSNAFGSLMHAHALKAHSLRINNQLVETTSLHAPQTSF